MRFFRIVTIIFFFSVKELSSQIACDVSSSECGSTVKERSQNITSNDHRLFLLSNSDLVSCQGRIWQWSIMHPGGNCYELKFQVWRLISGSTTDYKLIGENTFDRNMCPTSVLNDTSTNVNITVDTVERIPVQPNDILGWYQVPTSTDGMIEYDEALSGSNEYATVYVLPAGATCSNPSVGSTCSWTTVDGGGQGLAYSRQYSLKSYLEARDPMVIINLPATMSLFEDAAVGTFVFEVQSSYGYTWSTVVNPEFVFSLLTGAPNFQIDSTTGKITILAALDFETSATHTVDVQVTDSTGLDVVTGILTITVQDVNEKHSITNLPQSLQIDAQTGCPTTSTPLFTVTTTDPDTTPANHPSLSYNIISSDPLTDMFSVDAATGEVSCSTALQTWTGHTNYVLTIISSDGVFSSGPLNLSLSIVNITGAPNITNLPSVQTIREDSTVKTNIFQVLTQSDAFSTTLLYALTGVFPSTAASIFGIETDGWIYHTDKPNFDYVVLNEYTVQAQVSDTLYSLKSDAENLTLYLIWINEAPVFSPNTYTVEIAEGSTIGTELPLNLTATDRDTAVGDKLNFYILPSAGADRFTTYENSNHLYVASDLAVPSGNSSWTVSVSVMVVDQYGSTDTATVQVTVTDINNNAPTFSQSVYSASVSETATGGLSILALVATDNDAGNNAAITYTVDDTTADLYFEVQSTGVMYLKQPVNYTQYTSFTFNVTATDGGVPSLSAQTTVQITVTDTNDNRPYFYPTYYNHELPSDAEVGTLVTTVSAFDPDSSTVSTVTYINLVHQNNFDVGVLNGEIRLKSDVEKGNNYNLYLNSFDGGTNGLLSDPAVVRIDVFDAAKYLVDIFLEASLEPFNNQTLYNNFISELETLLNPWTVKIARLLVDDNRAIATIYALNDNTGSTISDLGKSKTFIHHDDIMDNLRTSLKGTPNDLLRGPTFATYKPYKVMPTHVIWLIDTIEGIVTLTLILLAVVAAIAGAITFISRRKKVLCFRKKMKVSPRPISVGSNRDGEFSLAYNNRSTTTSMTTLSTRALTPVLTPQVN